MSDNEARREIGEALTHTARNVEKAATYEDRRMALWDQTNSTLLGIMFELRCIAQTLEKSDG